MSSTKTQVHAGLLRHTAVLGSSRLTGNPQVLFWNCHILCTRRMRRARVSFMNGDFRISVGPRLLAAATSMQSLWWGADGDSREDSILEDPQLPETALGDVGGEQRMLPASRLTCPALPLLCTLQLCHALVLPSNHLSLHITHMGLETRGS